MYKLVIWIFTLSSGQICNSWLHAWTAGPYCPYEDHPCWLACRSTRKFRTKSRDIIPCHQVGGQVSLRNPSAKRTPPACWCHSSLHRMQVWCMLHFRSHIETFNLFLVCLLYELKLSMPRSPICYILSQVKHKVQIYLPYYRSVAHLFWMISCTSVMMLIERRKLSRWRWLCCKPLVLILAFHSPIVSFADMPR